MSIRDDFFAAQAKASLWDVAVSIKRGNPLPLDANAVYASYGEFIETKIADDKSVDVYTAGSLLEYAKTNPVAYPGQICAVVDVNETKIYYLDQNLDIQPVGIIPTGDNKSIEVTENGQVSVFGFNELTNENVRYLPVTKLVGEGDEAHLEIEWVAESAIAPELTAGLGIEIDGTEISAALVSETKLTGAAEAPEEKDGYATVAVRADKDGNLAVVLPTDEKVTTLVGEDAGKSVRAIVLEEVGSAGHLKRKIVEELPAVENADKDTIYMIKVNREVAGTLYTPYHRHYAEIGGSTTSFGSSETTDCISFDVVGGETYTLTNVQFDTTADGGDQQYGAFATAKDDYGDDTVLAHLQYDMPTIAPEGAVRLFVNVNKGTMPTLIKDVDGDQYREYMLFNYGTEDVPNWQFEQIGDTSVNLEGYATEEYVDGKIQEINTALGEHAQAAEQNYATKTALKEVSDNLANNYTDSNSLAATLANYATGAELEQHKQYAEETYAKAADVYTTAQIDAKIGTPGTPAEKNDEGQETKPAVPGSGVYEHVYSKSEVTALIADITGGESAADVKAELKEYKTSNDAKVKIITDEIWGAETDFTKASRIDNLETNVGTNTTDITNLKNSVNGPNGNDGLLHKVAVLESEVYADKTATDSRIDGLETGLNTLSTTVGGHTTKLTNLETVTIPELSGKIGANEEAIQNIVKSIGTVPANETVINLINKVDQKVKDIDLTPYALKTNVEEIYKKDADDKEAGLLIDERNRAIGEEDKLRQGIEHIFKAGAGEDPATGLLPDEIARATGRENELEAAIKAIYDLPTGTTNPTGILPALDKEVKDNAAALATLIGTVEEDNTKSVRAIATEVTKAAIGSAGHLKREIVSELPAIENADKDTIYMIRAGVNVLPTDRDEGNLDYTNVGSTLNSFGDNPDVDCLIYTIEPGHKYALSNVQGNETKAGLLTEHWGTIVANVNIGETFTTPDNVTVLLVNVLEDTTPILTDVTSAVESGDQYVEYMLIEGKFAQIGDTSVSLAGYATEKWVTDKGYITNAALNGYATEQFVTTQGYITNAALNGYATEQFVTDKGYQNADQVNDLILAKAYELPIASDKLGGVLSSSEGTANKVTVEGTGAMKVTKITTDILANGTEELILFGGNSGATQA